tara:strand:+ start:216 stop:860 length:645 start_codon:yes stop_codon:yes gene_type:complete
MATVEPKFSGVAPDQPQGAYFTVSIAQAGFSDAETTAGGRVSPCGASDFATKPTTLAQSLLVSRGQLRWKLMMNALAIRSNFRVVNIVTTYGSDAGDTAITTLAFGLVFENHDFIPTTGTSVDGSTTTTRVMYIADKIGEALNTTHTENCNVYDPTTSGGVTVRELSNTAVTVASVGANTGIIRDAITVTAVPGYAANTSGQLATDTSLTYSAE